MQQSASFWTDIKNLEEQLAKTPDSFCFARLADVYLKVGLIDDALHVARQGVQKHPGYLSGQRALALACHAKGMNDDALVALKLVTEAFPEDVASQKLIGRLYAAAGNQAGANSAFRIALEFAPDDVECRIELEALERSVCSAVRTPDYSEDEEDIIEDLELIEEIDVLDDEDAEEGEGGGDFDDAPATEVSPEVVEDVISVHDPLSTGTLAELYVTQGFIEKALDIYRAILAENPGDLSVSARISELELQNGRTAEPDTVAVGTVECISVEEGKDDPVLADFSFPAATFTPETISGLQPEVEVNPAVDEIQSYGTDFITQENNAAAVVPTVGAADNSVVVLNTWLENIRRIKSCR